MPEHMQAHLGKYARVVDFPPSKGGGRAGKSWDTFTDEDKKSWKENMRELLTMDAWTQPEEGSSQMELLDGKRLIQFDELIKLINGNRDFKESRASELVAWISMWLHWHDKGDICVFTNTDFCTKAPCDVHPNAITHLHTCIVQVTSCHTHFHPDYRPL